MNTISRRRSVFWDNKVTKRRPSAVTGEVNSAVDFLTHNSAAIAPDCAIVLDESQEGLPTS
jgi:hypothetical protein